MFGEEMFQTMLQVPNCLVFIVFLFGWLLSFGLFSEVEKVSVYFGEGVSREKQKIIRFVDD
jgi:hypothetical protein